jgi:hypothetical protein
VEDIAKLIGTIIGAMVVFTFFVLVYGFITACCVMLLWNYLFTGTSSILGQPLPPIDIWHSWALVLLTDMLIRSWTAKTAKGDSKRYVACHTSSPTRLSDPQTSRCTWLRQPRTSWNRSGSRCGARASRLDRRSSPRRLSTRRGNVHVVQEEEVGTCSASDVLSCAVDNGEVEPPETPAQRAALVAELVRMNGEVWEV